MASSEPAKKPAIDPLFDRGEPCSLMEPMLVREAQRRRDALADLAVTVVGASAALRSSLPPGIVPGLADLVRQDEIQKGTLPPHSLAVVESLLNRGEVPRGDIPMLAATSDRSARRITAALQMHGVVTSPTPRAPLRFAFPAALAAQWMPGLFPDRSPRDP